jgi:hypothetical protein
MRPPILAALLCALLAACAPAPALAAPAVTCHCYRDRAFDPARPAAADPYLLATARSSLLSAAFGTPKRQLVEAVMTGSDPDELWVASWAGARTGRAAEALLAARRAEGSWKAALAGGEGELGAAFAARLGAGASAAELATLAADDVLAARFGLEVPALRALRDGGATTSELVLAAVLAPSLGQAAPWLLAAVRSGHRSWGQLLDGAGLTPQDLDRLVRARVR